ncbi:MAG: hypothetical protein HND39_08310 [Ignavibacteriota bacterium]|jgi:predicted tellurium resistance membrane protein TerC|nr:MAG: hypothetical protein EDM72_05725 [Chlorobiota bacterium]MBE7476279.1 hypothetical protein [Ignavibacteriales bacterium]MBL1124237.1 hypothetical protein [Ignavibacteriota bacterium]MCC7093195.1 hypothetical protein [Ignavibacteriaceae bacterium]MCE7855859.1 hypothetical protein [Ignavibacteria bacterium CHB3]MEB2296952.1 SxtJ family membrane protein [Ignavibacteria bacterium]
MFKEEFGNIKETKKDLRKFGLTVGSVIAVIGIVLFYFEKSSAVYFAVIGGILIFLGVVFPRLLKQLNKFWMGLAIVLGFIMTRIILTTLFYLVITPIGFIAKIFGKKFMILKYDTSAETYWEKRSIIQKKPIDYERQF